MDAPRDIPAALALLAWQQASGCDWVLGERPVDWTARGPHQLGSGYRWPELAGPASPIQPSSADRPTPAGQVDDRSHSRQRAQTVLAPTGAGTEAMRLASGASTLHELERALRNFDGCGLKATATNLCFYRGAPAARLMIIGEAPGRDEDIEGRPFVGRAGRLLDKMLAAIGLSEADVHITNVVYWRPPGNRTPTPQETLACRPFLNRQIELVAPDAIVALGGSAAKEVLGVTEGVMRARGRWRNVTVTNRDIPAIATLHPAYLLRTPAAKKLAWIDLLTVQSKLLHSA